MSISWCLQASRHINLGLIYDKKNLSSYEINYRVSTSDQPPKQVLTRMTPAKFGSTFTTKTIFWGLLRHLVLSLLCI